MFTYFFLAALVLSVLAKLWLASRQIRYVAQHRNQVPERFAESIPLANHQLAADYTITKTRFSMLSILVQTGLLIAFTFFGLLQWLSVIWQPALGLAKYGELIYGAGLIVSVFAISSIVDVPFSLYSQFVIEEKFGFNKMTLKLWLLDGLKGLLLGALLGLPLLLAVLWLMQAMGQLWWLWTWLLWLGFSLLLLWIYPTFIAPLFNKFSPLEDQALKARIETLLKKCGFASKGLFVMDGSKRSAHGNAYFTGFGNAKRIVFFDTLIERLTGEEIEAVLAHELGHFKHKHVTQRMLVTFALSLGFLALLGWLSDKIWFYLGLGVVPNIAGGNQALALILFFLVLPVFTFFFGPLSSLTSRKHEFQADAFAASQTDAQALVSALVKLYKDNASTLTPEPLYSAFYYSHPPAAQRIDRLLAHPPATLAKTA